MFKRVVLSQLRHLLTSGGIGFDAWLIAHGASVSDAEVIISGIVAAIGFLWSFYHHWREEKKLAQKLETISRLEQIVVEKAQAGKENYDEKTTDYSRLNT